VEIYVRTVYGRKSNYVTTVVQVTLQVHNHDISFFCSVLVFIYFYVICLNFSKLIDSEIRFIKHFDLTFKLHLHVRSVSKQRLIFYQVGACRGQYLRNIDANLECHARMVV